MNRKVKVLELLERGYNVEKEFCAELTEQERSEPGSWERWAVKDSIAHNAAWRAHLANGLAAAAGGREPTAAGDYEHQNEVFFNKHHSRPWDEIETIAATAHRALVKQVSDLTEEDVNSSSILPWQGDRAMWRVALRTGFNHPLIHISDHLKRSGEIERTADLVGELATAVAGLDDDPEWQGVVKYNLACRHALLGETHPAIARLNEALALSPRLLDHARDDPDLEGIRGEPACQAVFADHDHPRD